MKLVNIGFGSMIAVDRIMAVVSPDSAPIKRMAQEARDRGILIDATFGRKTRAVLILDNDHLVLSALTPEAVTNRVEGGQVNVLEEEEALARKKKVC